MIAHIFNNENEKKQTRFYERAEEVFPQNQVCVRSSMKKSSVLATPIKLPCNKKVTDYFNFFSYLSSL